MISIICFYAQMLNKCMDEVCKVAICRFETPQEVKSFSMDRLEIGSHMPK
jgi:hypothetical protein